MIKERFRFSAVDLFIKLYFNRWGLVNTFQKTGYYTKIKIVLEMDWKVDGLEEF